MDGTKLVQFQCPIKLLEEVDEKVKQEGKYAHRTDLLLNLLRKYISD